MFKTAKSGTRPARRMPHPLKITALLYLKEALLKEQYEECAAIIATAKEFGALDWQIRLLLEDPKRSPG